MCFDMRTGTVVCGRWNRNVYRIEGVAGRGATATVYAARGPAGRVALKVADDEACVLVEADMLRNLEARGVLPGPFLRDVDEADIDGRSVLFLALDWVDGIPLHRFPAGRRPAVAAAVLTQVLDGLERLHAAGFVFGDLKPANVLVVPGSLPRAVMIDFGGVTPRGRCVRAHSELYDRAAWGAGGRVAEPAYDLFAAALTFLAAVIGEAPLAAALARPQPVVALCDIIRADSRLAPYRRVLEPAFHGRWASATAMGRALAAASGAGAEDAAAWDRLTVGLMGACAAAAGWLLLVSAAWWERL
nr:serine/threonine protein kinase [Bacillota bacterium]